MYGDKDSDMKSNRHDTACASLSYTHVKHHLTVQFGCKT